MAIFTDNRDSALRAIRHAQNGAPTTPIWLFSTQTPPPAISALCDHVFVRPNPLDLLATAQRSLWPRRAALAIGDWSGPASTLLKIAPFFLPPFRTLFLNESGDFLPGAPGPLASHCRQRLRERAHNSRVRAGEIVADTWALLRHHIWRSGPVNHVRDRARAVSLFLAGSALRATHYPHRRLFHKLHGAQPLQVQTQPAPGARGLVAFYQRDHDWNPDELRRLSESTNARFLVWHNGAGPGPVDDLLPLFDDPATFAVSRQSSFRAWKPTLFPTAPFRTLQPGECTRVLAPLGSSIVLDLHKLAALGIPRVSHPITAWLILFWKAAAAGWHSYSAGQDGALAPQPDFPSEEAAFLAHIALDPDFRALGPQQPLLARGNVAFSVQSLAPARTPVPGRPRVLIVSPFLPFPLSHGGAVRIYNLCRALAGRVEFALIALREQHETVDYARLHELFREVRIVDVDQTAPTSRELPQQVRQHECPALRAAIADLCGSWRPDLIQFEYTHTAALKDAAPGIPAILVEHDITHSLYRQLAEAEPSRKATREYQRWLAFENRALSSFEGVWTVSEADRKLAISSGSRAPERTFAIANGVDTERFRPTPEPQGPPEILYVGSFRHLPNILAFERLRSEIMPHIWERFPEARLRVVAGPRHDYFWQRFHRESHGRPGDPRIVIHDFVEDLRPLYAAATAVAVPLAVSAGTNIKVMEAMASGRAVVSTPAGCAGLELEDARDLLVRDSSAALAAALCDLLADPQLRQTIAAQARQTAEERFSWSAIAEDAFRSYQALL